MPAMYTVKDRDTLYGIANKLKVSPDVILKINPKFTSLKPGMVVNVPGTKGRSTIPKIPGVPNRPPGAYNVPAPAVKTRPPGAYNVPLPSQLPQVKPWGSGVYTVNARLPGYGRNDNKSNIDSIVLRINSASQGNGQFPVVVDRAISDAISKYYPSSTQPAGDAYMIANGYVRNPVTGSWVLTGTPMSGRNAYRPAGSTGGAPSPVAASAGYTVSQMQQKTYENYLKYSGLTSLPASGDIAGWRKYYEWENSVRWGGGIDSAFVGSTSAMGGLAQSGYNLKGMPFSKTPWRDRYKRKRHPELPPGPDNGGGEYIPPTDTPGGYTSPTKVNYINNYYVSPPRQNYSNNYVSYGVGLIHWRV